MYGPNISPLIVDVTMETDERLHVKIYDPKNKRWEIPERLALLQQPDGWNWRASPAPHMSMVVPFLVLVTLNL